VPLPSPWPQTAPTAGQRAAYAEAQPRPFWLDSLPDRPVHDPLTGSTGADLCIVGGGYTGLWAALAAKAADPGRDVIVLEATRCGSGASGRNGGFLEASLTHGLANGLSRFPDEMGQLEALAAENFNGLRDDLTRHGINCDYETPGVLTVALEPRELDELREEVELARRFGHDVELLDADGVRAQVNSPTYLGAVWDRSGSALMHAEALMTEPLSESQRQAIGWQHRHGISDMGNQFHYYRPTADGRILYGGYDAVYRYGGDVGPHRDEDDATFATLSQHFFTTFPQLEGLRFSHRWGGAIDTCSRFSVFFGRAYGGRVVYALGYTGLGVSATRFGARVALDLLDGRTTPATQLRMVRRRPVPFPPEPLRFGVIALTRNRLAAADRNEGRRGVWLRTLDRLGLGFDS
jgi:glycine/D-amino acid oxidase-like deaminating enzyme